MARILHNRSMRITSILLSGLMLFAVACSKDEKIVEKVVEKEVPAKQEQPTTYIVGDPSQYFYGTKLANFIMLPTLKDQVLYMISNRSYKDTKEILTHEERVKDQTPSTAKVTEEELDFYTEDRVMSPLEPYNDKSGKRYFKFGKKNQSEYFLVFDVYGFGLRLVGYLYEDVLYQLNQDYINISVSEDQSIISISFLDSLYRDGTKYLRRLTFSTKKPAPKILNSGERYMYLIGPDVISRHNQVKPLVISVCGKDLYEHKNLIDPVVKQWQDVLVGRLDTQLKYQLEGCPPFTDVNTHNIYMIDAYKTTPEITSGMGAMTVYLLGEELFDSDIIFYKYELLKSTENFLTHEYAEYFQVLLVHEIGHMLGLAHQFDGVTPSVMAYQNHTTLQPYDIKAIQALYPLVNPQQ